MSCNIYNADCATVLRCMPDANIDLTITSPPYDNLRDYKGYTLDIESIIKNLYRVTKEGGTVVWIVSDATVNGSETGSSFRQALKFIDVGFNLHDTMIWEKPTFTATGALQTRYAQVFEYMFIFTKGKIKTFNPIRDRVSTTNNRTKSINVHGGIRQKDGTFRKMSSQGKPIAKIGQRFNVWKMPACVSNTERTGHPAQFPKKLVHDHIISWSNEGDTILDPFMGSGTTGKVAIETGRNFIGIEISKDYCEIARKRLRQPFQQMLL